MSAKRERFMALLGPIRGSLEATCRHLLWDRRQVEDCLQTAILEAYAGFDRFEEGTNFRAWVCKYVWNIVMNSNRRYERIRRIESVGGGDVPVDPAGGQGELTEHGYDEILADPDSFLECVDDRVKQSVLALNPPERAVLILRAVAGLAYKDIARILDIPMGSVMGYLHRARTKLRGELSTYAQEMGLATTGGRL